MLQLGERDPYPGTWIQGVGDYPEKDGTAKTVAVAIGPEFGTVGRQLVIDAAKEAVKIADLLVVCGFEFDALAVAGCYVRPLQLLQPRFNPDQVMGDETLRVVSL